MSTSPEPSEIPAKAIEALLSTQGLPEDVRHDLLTAKTYEEKCFAIHGLGARDRLSMEFVQGFNARHGMLLGQAGVTSTIYLTNNGKIPPAGGWPAS